MKKLLLILITLFTAHTIFACTASFNFNLVPTNNDLLRVAFNNTSTSGNINGLFIGSATIDYGDGIIAHNPFQQGTVYHSYANPGTYTVKLRIEVVDSINNTRNVCRDSITQTVTVAYGPCATKITTTKVNDSTYTFTANTPRGTSGMTYNWSFGDGATATGSPVTHTYGSVGNNTSGSYTVTLTATSTTNCSYTNRTTVTVPVTRPPLNCANANASFNVNINNNIVTIQNTSTTPGNNTRNVYIFNYGDNTPNTPSATHVYTTAGNYKITMYAKWESFDSTQRCFDTADKRVNITVIPPPPPPFNCNNANASFNVTISGNVVTIQNTSTRPNVNATSTYRFNYGDNTANTTSMSHTYTAAGNYKITMYAKWDDSVNTCYDTADKRVNITTTTPPPQAANRIEGAVIGDSMRAASYKVWLIVFDSLRRTLTAVDSAFVNNGNGGAMPTFKFDNKPAATYLVKAMQVITNANTRPTMIPTYSERTPYWRTARRIYHTNGTNTRNNIYMIPGIPRRGPGFVGGSIRHGANRMARTTGADENSFIVILKDKAGEPVDFTYTDANGAYSFSDVEEGDYTIYPEIDGFTTVEANVTVKAGAETINNVDFRVNTTTQIVTPEGTAVANVTADNSTLSVYPNPTTGIIKIDGLQKGLNNVTVTDVAGRVVLQTAINYVSGTSTVDLSTAGVGIYFISIKAEGVNYTNKLILQH